MSDHRHFELEGHLKDDEDFTSLSANSLSTIPVCPGTHKSY